MLKLEKIYRIFDGDPCKIHGFEVVDLKYGPIVVISLKRIIKKDEDIDDEENELVVIRLSDGKVLKRKILEYPLLSLYYVENRKELFGVSNGAISNVNLNSLKVTKRKFLDVDIGKVVSIKCQISRNSLCFLSRSQGDKSFQYYRGYHIRDSNIFSLRFYDMDFKTLFFQKAMVYENVFVKSFLDEGILLLESANTLKVINIRRIESEFSFDDLSGHETGILKTLGGSGIMNEIYVGRVVSSMIIPGEGRERSKNILCIGTRYTGIKFYRNYYQRNKMVGVGVVSKTDFGGHYLEASYLESVLVSTDREGKSNLLVWLDRSPRIFYTKSNNLNEEILKKEPKVEEGKKEESLCYREYPIDFGSIVEVKYEFDTQKEEKEGEGEKEKILPGIFEADSKTSPCLDGSQGELKQIEGGKNILSIGFVSGTIRVWRNEKWKDLSSEVVSMDEQERVLFVLNSLSAVNENLGILQCKVLGRDFQIPKFLLTG